MYACSPEWKGDWIPERDLERILTLLAENIAPSPYGSQTVSLNYGLHFTGGEPFLNYDLLCQAVEIAGELNIPSSFVETNCYWCVNDKVTRDKLRLLKGKGLKGILISVNPFYLEYVPFERTERGIRVSDEIFGTNLMVYQVEYYRRFLAMRVRGRLTFKDYLMQERGEDFAQHVEFFLMGRAPYKLGKDLERVFPKYPVSSFFDEPCRPSFLRNWHNHFDNYGNYVPGYCGGISLGDCRNLRDLLEKGIETEEDPILGLLIDEDLERLLEFARDFGYEESSEGYFSKCHACVDMRKYLSGREDFKELKPNEFYMHLD